jgi:hypothetical protein
MAPGKTTPDLLALAEAALIAVNAKDVARNIKTGGM